MGRGKEIRPRSGFPQIEIDGDFFPISGAACHSIAMGQEVTTMPYRGSRLHHIDLARYSGEE